MNEIVAQETNSAQIEVEKTRVLQEVQAQVLVAQKCPRDEQKSFVYILYFITGGDYYNH